MHVMTCRIGDALRFETGASIAIHSRQGERIGLSATASAGTVLVLDGAPVRPIIGQRNTWGYLFSLQALRRFILGQIEFRIWLPGELVPLAADCEGWLHVGILSVGVEPPLALPSPVVVAPPLTHTDDGCRPLSRGIGMDTLGRAFGDDMGAVSCWF